MNTNENFETFAFFCRKREEVEISESITPIESKDIWASRCKQKPIMCNEKECPRLRRIKAKS